MDELEYLRDWRAGLPGPSAAAMSRGEAALDRAIAEERGRAGSRGAGPLRERMARWRWVLAGSAALLVLALVAFVAFGLGGGSATGGQDIAYGEALERFPSETASDVVSWADQVSVVTAVAATEIPEEDVPPAREAAGEGMINRNVTFRIDRTIWHREGAPSLEGTFDAVKYGWVLHDFKRTRFAAMGTPWTEVGSQYLMPLAYDHDRWLPILPAAVFAYEGGHVTPVEYQDTALAKQLSGDTLDQATAVFDTAQPDPAAAKHFDLQPTARQKAIIAEREAEAGR